MDGETPGGFLLATQDYVQTNAITSANLATNLTTALAPYVLTSTLSSYATITALNSAISAIPIYSLPIAGDSTGALGGVKVDGTSITINPATGVISGSNQFTLPIATTSVLGGVKVDGVTISINPTTGVISGSNQYALPTATTTVKGGVIIPAVGTSGITNSSGTIGLATATTTQLGGVKVDGTTITVNNGVISGANTYVLPTATASILGGVKVPAVANSGISITDGAIRLATATTNQLGGVKVDGVTITINGSGVIAASITGAIVFQGGWSAATNTPTLSNASSAYNTNGFEFVTVAAGTVNFGAGNVSFSVGDNVIYDGTKWVKIPIGSSAGTTSNNLTFSDSGTGDAVDSTFNGSSILTVSYNTIGASPLAGSASLTTAGVISTGTWNGSLISPTYGGTGVNNGNRTLTITGGNRTLDQDVSNGAAPVFEGTNFSGSATGLAVGSATSATNATNAGKSTNIAGGLANQIPYQTAADTTSFLSAPADNTYLRYTTAGGIVWGAVATATAAGTATNIAGGAANQIVVQSGTGATTFITAPTTTNTYLRWTGSAFAFSSVAGATGGTVTSVTGTGTVSGISLSGTVTGSGNITLGGTLSLVSPGAIGGTTASTGRFTTLQTTGTGSTTAAAGQIYLNGATLNRIDYNTNGVAAPSFGGISAGTKIILYPANAVNSADYAIGITGSTLWFGLPTAAETFRWYGGTTSVMALTGAGALSATSFEGAHNGTTGATTPNSGAFTTLSASSTVSGTGFSTYLASPPAIGGSAAAAGAFTSLTAAGLPVPVLPAITQLAVTNNLAVAYRFDQYGTADDPTIYAISGTTIAFNLNVTGHPFLIQTSGGVNYNDGLVHVSTTGTVVTGASAQGQQTGTLYWKIPVGTVGNYRYACSIHTVAMVGVITIKNIASMA
jgi:plastocyanin